MQILFALAMIGLAAAFGLEAAGYNATASRTPVLLSWVVGLLAVGMLAEAGLTRRRRIKAMPAGSPVETVEQHAGDSLPRALLFLVLVILYAASFQLLGFVVGSTVFLAVSLLLFRATRLHLAILTIIASVGLIYVVFIELLRLPVPLWPTY